MSDKAVQSTNQPTKRPRPSGREKDEYSGYKLWTFQRWAWEFLRRNAEFRAACKRATGNPDKEKAVAEQFGLKKFVNFTKGSRKPSWSPKFRSASVDVWRWQQGARKPAITIRAGQALVRFDLSPCTGDVSVLKAQLEDARKRLERLQKLYLAEVNSPEPKSGNRKPIYFLNSLRLLDLLATKVEPGRALRLVHEHPKTRAPMTDPEALDKYRKQLNLAKEMASNGYRLLANRIGAPATT